MGCQNPEVPTPHLDALAAQGVLFDRAYCPNPTCTPTRASILTGQYPSQHGAYSLGTKLMEDRPTMNEVWRASGWRTGIVGKAHFQPLTSTSEHVSLESYPTLQDLEFWRGFHGPFYGFDDFELARNHTDEAHVGQHYALWMEEKGFKNWREHFQKPTGTREAQSLSWSLPEEFHYNAWISERTNVLLERYAQAQRPFFLWSSYFDPHPSYLVSAPWDKLIDPAVITVPRGRPGEHDVNPVFHRYAMDPHPSPEKYGIGGRTHWIHGLKSHVQDEEELRREIAVYYGMVAFMDEHIGRTLRRLDELGLADNTLVVFTSDHGHFYGHHGLNAKGPFHYEDGVRVPMIVRWPGCTPAGVRSNALQSLVDLPPSFLSAAGISKPAWMSGLDQTSVWSGAADSVRAWCLVENNHEPGVAELRTYIDERYKVTVYRGWDDGELYDLEEDPGEFRNLWSDSAALELRARLLQKFIQAQMASDILPMPRVSVA